MDFFTEAAEHLQVLRGVLGDAGDPDRIATTMPSLSDAGVLAVVAETTAVIAAMEKVRIVASGVAASRSTREQGHSGLAQSNGHRTPVELVQHLTGLSRGAAAKQVRLGESLLASAPVPGGGEGGTGPAGGEDVRPEGDRADREVTEPWHACLGRALLAGSISSDQHDAILRGLGEPPRVAETETDDEETVNAGTVQAWSVAAQQLVEEAPYRSVEELARTARSVRDRLDPVGAGERFEARFQARSFRLRNGDDGTVRGFFSFDDEGAAWVRTIIDSALRPRRGGPRFVDPVEQERAEALAADPRSNDQLAYDLILDVLRAGALADAATVFGTRQAGLRVVAIADPDGQPSATVPAHCEDDGGTLPAWLAGRQACDVGTRVCTLDAEGNPLDLGREQRLFSAKQKLALALRDGGCRWTGCDRPASYCEAHHADEWAAHHGRTDIDRGILLCRFHHMQLHHGRWRITRDSKADFRLHPPDGHAPITLSPRLALRYAWNDTAPPPKRFLPAA
ncbi:DUF222 domain-containing protein [Humibacter sp.]|uniref:HNH endonuclease signature motif containing protein n=1 Tax=Humibacter sp. TaxID=1940291 RepID=UPI003F7E9462